MTLIRNATISHVRIRTSDCTSQNTTLQHKVSDFCSIICSSVPKQMSMNTDVFICLDILQCQWEVHQVSFRTAYWSHLQGTRHPTNQWCGGTSQNIKDL